MNDGNRKNLQSNTLKFFRVNVTSERIWRISISLKVKVMNEYFSDTSRIVIELSDIFLVPKPPLSATDI